MYCKTWDVFAFILMVLCASSGADLTPLFDADYGDTELVRGGRVQFGFLSWLRLHLRYGMAAADLEDSGRLHCSRRQCVKQT